MVMHLNKKSPRLFKNNENDIDQKKKLQVNFNRYRKIEKEKKL